VRECPRSHNEEPVRCAHVGTLAAVVYEDARSPSGYAVTYYHEGSRGSISSWIPLPLEERFDEWCVTWGLLNRRDA